MTNSRNPMKKIIDTRDSYDLEREYMTDFELAGAAGLPDHVINGYAEDGILRYKETADRGRIYPADSLETLQSIHDMKERGLTNEEIRAELKKGQIA